MLTFKINNEPTNDLLRPKNLRFLSRTNLIKPHEQFKLLYLRNKSTY
jgi:hypothetical protein